MVSKTFLITLVLALVFADQRNFLYGIPCFFCKYRYAFPYTLPFTFPKWTTGDVSTGNPFAVENATAGCCVGLGACNEVDLASTLWRISKCS